MTYSKTYTPKFLMQPGENQSQKRWEASNNV